MRSSESLRAKADQRDATRQARSGGRGSWLIGETLEHALAALKRELAGEGARQVDDEA